MIKSLKALGILFATLGVVSCCDQTKTCSKMDISNDLTEAEIKRGLFTPEVMWKMNRLGGATLSPNGKMALYTVSKYKMEENSGKTSIVTQELGSKEPICLVESGGSPVWSGDGSVVYYTSSQSGSSQVWSIDVTSSVKSQITSVDGGVSGFRVSPTEDKILYISGVKVAKHKSSEIYSDLPESKARVYDDLMVRHWDYWEEGIYKHIFVGDIVEGKLQNQKDIMPNEPWDAPLAPYFSNDEIAWNNSGSKIAYTCKKCVGAEYAVSTDSDIYLYDLDTEKTTNLMKESGGEWLGYDKYPVFSPDDKSIAFLSMKRAGNESDKSRLMVMNLESLESTDLTHAFDYNASNVIWQGNDKLYFISPMSATHQVCSVDVSGSVSVLTSGEHDLISLSISEGSAVVSLTTLSDAAELFNLDLNSGALSQITNLNEMIYKDIKFGDVKKRMVKTTDGKEMLTWVVYPPDFDSTKKYPTLLYCQGGPQSVVSQFWSYRWNAQVIAAEGYIVVMPNRRGLPSFGQEWLDQISGDYSGQNIKDYLSAIDDVSKESYVDTDNLGCIGASYGGYSAFYLAGHHEGRFKAFIAHCGIFNFESMYGETEELYFVNNDYGGSYWSDDATAKRSYANSPHKFVDKWDTPILIITGEYDFRIPYTQSLQAFTAAKLLGVPARLVVFEDEAHQVFKPQNSIAWNREFFGWLNTYLK